MKKERKVFTKIKLECGECTIYEPKAYDIMFTQLDLLKGGEFVELGFFPFFLVRVIEINDNKITIRQLLDISGADYLEITNISNLYFEKFNLNNIMR